MINYEQVRNIMCDCLFAEMPADDTKCIGIPSVTRLFALNPSKVELHRSEIFTILRELPLEFWDQKSGGKDGYTFMSLPFDRDGNQWGEQVNADELMTLGLATGYMRYMFPIEMWTMLPGKVPYLIISEDAADVEIITVKDFKNGKVSISAIVSSADMQNS